MRKHIFLTMAACVLLALMGGTAHAASVIEGLCDGQLGDPAKGKSKPGSGTISAATIFPKQLLAPYSGMKITRIRVGLALGYGLSDLRGWVRTALDADNLASAAITDPQVGWNEVAFDTPVTIPAETDLVFGYSFEQTKSCKCISVAGPDELEGFAPAADGFWLCKNGAWENRSADNFGSVCVEVVIEDESLPQKDLAVVSASIARPQVRYGDTFQVDFTVRNKAMEPVSGASYTVSVEGHEVARFTSDTSLSHRQQESFSCQVNSDLVPLGLNHTVTVEAALEGDERTGNNTATALFSTYETSYEHKLLIEEFSTEECPNCPRAIETFATLMEEGFEEKTVSVVHHVGFYTDWLTVDDDVAYTWFYGIDGTFAPAAMYDRRPFTDYGGSNGSSGMGVVPVTQVAYPDNVRPQLEAALAFPAFVSVAPTLSYNADTRQMDVTVRMEKQDIFDTQCAEPRLTVFVVEDSILHHHQAGYSSSTFHHRHVNRGHLSDVWGDPVTFTDGTAERTYSITLPELWNAHHVGVVAFVNNRDEDNRNNNIVFNAAHATVKDFELGVEDAVQDARPVSVSYYTVGGVRTDAPKGLSIRVARYADGTIRTDKAVR